MDFRNWLENDYYHLLGINQTATAEEINKAYRLKAKHTHPDIYPINSIEHVLAEKSFKNLLLARDTLLDLEKRAEYDKERQSIQECYVSYISTSYSLPPQVKESNINKHSFKEKLKIQLEKDEKSEYTYSPESNAYIQENFYDEEELSKEEKALLYKRQGATKFYNMGLKALGYRDYRRALMYFKSAQYLDPGLKVPKGYFPRDYKED